MEYRYMPAIARLITEGQRAMLDLCMFAEGGENQEELVAVGDRGKVEARLPSGLALTGLRDGEWFSPTVETFGSGEGRGNGA